MSRLSRAIRILLLVLTVLVVLTGGAAAAAWWWNPWADEARDEHPVRELVVGGQPPLPGRWSSSYTAGESDPDEGTRSWVGPNRAELDQTIRRYSSPLWASRDFDSGDPTSRLAEYYDLIVERTPPAGLGKADQARYFCGQVHGRPGECDSWWVLLRYGQYVVEIQSFDVPSTQAERVPTWLVEFVRATDQGIRSRTGG